MTLAAWIMMLVTWAIVVFFTGRFFWMVLTKPTREEDDPADDAD